MKVAVIGAGRWGQNHVSTLHEMGALAAVAEMSTPLREAVEREFPDVRTYRDHQELLATDIDAVVIATPVATHYGIARDALEAGKDVLVEKPLTLRTKDAEDLVALAEANDRVLMVGHLLIYQPAIAWIRDYLTQGRLGSLRSMHQERLNLGTAREVENALWSLGVHDIAVLLHLVGETPHRMAVTGQRPEGRRVEDDIYLHLAFPSGVQAHLHNSWLWPEKRRRLTIVGTEGMLVYDEIAQSVTLHRKRIDSELRNVDEGSETVYEGAAQPLRLELEHFMSCVRTRATPRSDGKSGLEVIRVLEDADRKLVTV